MGLGYPPKMTPNVGCHARQLITFRRGPKFDGYLLFCRSRVRLPPAPQGAVAQLDRAAEHPSAIPCPRRFCFGPGGPKFDGYRVAGSKPVGFIWEPVAQSGRAGSVDDPMTARLLVGMKGGRREATLSKSTSALRPWSIGMNVFANTLPAGRKLRVTWSAGGSSPQALETAL